MAFHINRTVLYGECDPAGIMYNPNIADWLVEATLGFLTSCLGSPAQRYMHAMGYSLPARALNLEFLNSMTWDEVIDVEVTLSEMRSRSFTVAVSGTNQAGQLTFKGQLTMVSISPAEKRAVQLPKELKEALENQE